MDSFTEVTHEGWGGRIMQSIKGVAVGGILFLVSFPLLFWNEGRAVKTAKRLEEGAGAAVSLTSTEVDAANEGKLVHLTGQATTDEELTDEAFGVTVTGIKLRRTVTMHQWKESKRTRRRKKLGGGTRTETTYSYSKVWSERSIDSTSFRESTGHTNPGAMPYQSQSVAAEKVTLGGFRLSKSLVARIEGGSPVTVRAEDLPEALEGKAKAAAGGFYVGANPAAPVVGDLKIVFSVVKPQVVSLISRQIGDTFEPYQAKAGGTIEMVAAGAQSAESMFEEAKAANVTMTWVLRLVGFVVMAIGLALMAQPMVVLADVLPILGDILGFGVALFAGVTALCLSLVTIAIAWLLYRPVLAVVLIAVGVGAVVAVRQLAQGRKARAAASAP